MKFTKLLRIVGLAALLLFTLAGIYLLTRPKPPKPPKPPRTVSSIDDVEAYLEDLVAYGTPPGLSLAVVRDGQLVYSKGFGWADGPNRVPATPQTVYKWWSMTKIATAIAILQLDEQGLLDLDDPVQEHLPFFEVTYPSQTSETITIRHLLNHSSGLPDNVPAVIGWMHLEDEPRPDQTQLLQAVLPDYDRLKFEPGDHAEYTNVGYMVLGAVIEAVSGQSYEDYVLAHIIRPLGMADTGFVYSEAMLPHAAVGSHPLISLESAFLPLFYGQRLGGFIRETTGGKIWFNRFYADSDPPTGLIGPTTDVARLLAAYVNGGQLDGTRILSAEQVRVMTHEGHVRSTNKGQTDTPFQGLGWEIHPQDNSFYLAHGGGGPGFGSAMRIYPERSLGMVVIANDTTYVPEEILDLVAGLDW